MTVIDRPLPVGSLLREWRQRRRLSQLELSLEADVSTRHLSYVETGRSRPTSQMILKLADRLDVPLRERNALLLAGGYAPAYPEHGLDSPDLAAVCEALRQVLAGHEPYPAVVVDRSWTLVDANAAIGVLTEGAAPHLLEPPANVLRLALHPDGLAPRTANLGQWRAHLLHRLRHQAEATADVGLAELYRELADYPCDDPQPVVDLPGQGSSIVVPLRYRYQGTELSFFSTTAVFGTPLDVTVAELAIESFYPADRATAEFLRRRAG
ncbi:helix-turn-helix domain-containing protein [Actinocatenispora rupis]|uniref:Transcriptional regulator n=1 Tax=Actinocatenispora rupis TaxID=519421 RepID=A0A8J3NE36_9ACTN|nr:helix-turn-helix transcriptional regulator [Actinocatenispora rupis]GID15934.1 transcriptional regulator [Actinocatenispora rupis]